MRSEGQYTETTLRIIYSEIEGPKFYHVYIYNEDTKKYDYYKVVQAETVAWKSGYKLVDYYNLLSTQFMPIMIELFDTANATVKKIGASKAIIATGKTIKDKFGSYKDLEDFFKRTLKGKSNFTDSCLRTMLVDDKTIKSTYNAKQRSVNDAAKSNYLGEKYRIKEDKTSFLNIVRKTK